MPENAKKVRLDKFLTQAAELTRSEAKQKIKKGSVTVNEELIKKPEVKISLQDRVCIDGEEVLYEQYRYIMLHKPAGVISATEDAEDRTVLDLIAEGKKGLFRLEGWIKIQRDCYCLRMMVCWHIIFCHQKSI